MSPETHRIITAIFYALLIVHLLALDFLAYHLLLAAS